MNKEIKQLNLEETAPIKIVLLYLEKLEKLNEKERSVIITSIDIINHPLFIK